MTRWHKQSDANTHFLTTNVRSRIPLFKVFPRSCEILLESLNHHRKKYPLQVAAFVIMPDHVHLIIRRTAPFNLSDFLRDWKGYVAHMVVKQLKQGHKDGILQQLATTPKRLRDSSYQVFQSDTHVEAIFSRRFFRQKLNYIHNNPVVEGLVNTPVQYQYSSARNYYLNDDSVFQIDRIEL